MILPRRLYRTADGAFCEENDPAQAWVYHPKGYVVQDAEAEKIGLKDYLDRTGYSETAGVGAEMPPEEKAVAQADTEDKAVDAESTEDKAELEPGLHIDLAARRSRRGGA